jgi:hypothetical protein
MSWPGTLARALERSPRGETTVDGHGFDVRKNAPRRMTLAERREVRGHPARPVPAWIPRVHAARGFFVYHANPLSVGRGSIAAEPINGNRVLTVVLRLKRRRCALDNPGCGRQLAGGFPSRAVVWEHDCSRRSSARGGRLAWPSTAERRVMVTRASARRTDSRESRHPRLEAEREGHTTLGRSPRSGACRLRRAGRCRGAGRTRRPWSIERQRGSQLRLELVTEPGGDERPG